MSLDWEINRKKLLEAVDSEKLIKLIKEHEVIYHYNFSKIKCPEKDRAWISVARKLGCTVKSVKLKWTHLRTTYYNFLRREALAITEKKRYTIWKHAKAMEFVKPHITKGVPVKKIDSTDKLPNYKERNDLLEREANAITAKKRYTIWDYAKAMELVKPHITMGVPVREINNTEKLPNYKERNDSPSTSKSKSEETTLIQTEKYDYSNVKMTIDDNLDAIPITDEPSLIETKKYDSSNVVAISDDDLDDIPFAEEDDLMGENLDEDELDPSLEDEDKQPKSTTSNSNLNAMLSPIYTTAVFDEDDLFFLGFSRTIKKFPPIQKSRAKLRFAKVIMGLEKEIINNS